MRDRHLLRDISREAFESRKAELKRDGLAGRWFSPLELHALPRLGGVPVTDLTQTDIRDTLAPIWHTKSATAKKAADRLKIVLDARLGRLGEELWTSVRVRGADMLKLWRSAHAIFERSKFDWAELR